MLEGEGGANRSASGLTSRKCLERLAAALTASSPVGGVSGCYVLRNWIGMARHTVQVNNCSIGTGLDECLGHHISETIRFHMSTRYLFSIR